LYLEQTEKKEKKMEGLPRGMNFGGAEKGDETTQDMESGKAIMFRDSYWERDKKKVTNIGGGGT